jgi:hypothetical protein
MFHLPRVLPLTAETLGETTVGPFPDRDALMRDVTAFFPDGRWHDDWWHAESEAGWVELHTFEHEGLYLSMRCSLRANYDAVVQALCDRYGWIAFSDAPRLFQPGHAPIDLS